MRKRKNKLLIILAFLLWSAPSGSQTFVKPDKGQWALFREGKKISGSYDTIFDFDASGKVCIGCFRRRTQLPNKLIKVYTTSWSCNYLNAAGQRLRIKVPGNDSCSVFGLSKNSVAAKNASDLFPVTVSNKRYLVSRDFAQLTFKGLNDVNGSGYDGLYIAEQLNEAETPLTGVINTREATVIPFRYSSIGFNTADSLIIACSAGLRQNSEDEVFNYSGKKVYGSRRHIDIMTKQYAVLQVFEPEEKYFIHNLSSGTETPLEADELKHYRDQLLLVRQKRDWYLYDALTGKKSFFKSAKDEKN
jgi:hypothetical protein